MREFLKGLELDQETIDTIMAEHGKLITQDKEEILSLKKELNSFEKEKQSYEKKIQDYETKNKSNEEALKNLQSITDERNSLKNQLQMSDSNVKKEFMEFVTSKVSSQVNDDTDFATALENYKKENPQYFGETIVKKVQSSPTLNGGSKETTTSDIMNDILRSAKD